jgi:hypothetical protein
MRYLASICFYRARGGPNGWRETVTCNTQDADMTWDEVQAWFAHCRAEWSMDLGWKILSQKVKNV